MIKCSVIAARRDIAASRVFGEGLINGVISGGRDAQQSSFLAESW